MFKELQDDVLSSRIFLIGFGLFGWVLCLPVWSVDGDVAGPKCGLGKGRSPLYS